MQCSVVQCSPGQIGVMKCSSAVDTICDVLPGDNNDAVQCNPANGLLIRKHQFSALQHRVEGEV